jgi:cobalt-precorrin-5B (C1)-methyltransferase
MTTGRRSERFSQRRWPKLPEEAFVQIGDYFAKSMEMAADQGFAEVMLAIFFYSTSS